MGAVVAERTWTIEELAALPEDEFQHELQEGMLVSEPRPAYGHGHIAFRVTFEVGRYVIEHGLGEVVTCDPGFILARSPDTLRGPDVAFVRRDRLAGIDRGRPFEGAPDLAIEVLSPSNTAAAMHAKVADYLAAGAKAVWLIDADRPRVRVYTTLLTPKVLGPDDRIDGGDVLPGFSVRVGDLFGRGEGSAS